MRLRSIKFRWLTAALVGILLGGCSMMGNMAGSMGMAPMGSYGDVSDAKDLWTVLKNKQLVGENAKRANVYMGTPPHGKVLETLHQKITVDGRTGLAIIKRNYGGDGVSINSDKETPAKFLKAVTVMFKRENGYDDEDKNWFYAKFKPDGSLFTKSKMGMNLQLAGRVAKGKPEGCISCHQSAPGGDFVFAQDIKI